ncbi:MAG: HDIG domain-containing protein [Bacteroidales bacterium]|nr:HDIG domain-containing protein [Bacteroidales bacterium]MDD4672699.1 HDIG domain-containing protein [Bacteroidales bacterium]MDY0347872.1 HDIG domain-containing protein [Tenuifilaceae bacterium]
MKKIFRFIKKYFREILRVAYFVIAIVLIVLALPQERRFKYEFQRGKVWMHNDLVAPFDFSIYKTDAELIAERNAILNKFKPFFKLDTGNVSEVIQKYRSDIQRVISGFDEDVQVSPEALQMFEDTLRYVYNVGILFPNEYAELQSAMQNGITVVFHNQAFDSSVDHVFMVNSATERLSRVFKDVFSKAVDSIYYKDFKNISISSYVKPNLKYDPESTKQVKQDMMANLSETKGLIYSGERIISNGEVVNADLYQILFSLKREYESRLNLIDDTRLLVVGQALVVTVLFMVLFLFLFHFRRDILDSDSKVLFILLLITTLTVISVLLLRRELVSIYIIPFAIIPIFIRTFFDSRLALFVHLVTVFLVGFFVPNSFEFVFIHFIAGVVAIVSLAKVYRRSKLFMSVGLIFLTYSVLYLGIVLIQEGTPMAMNPLYIAWFAGNALLLLASYQLIYVFEKMFGFLSDTTLMELGDTNQNLLRKLAEVAPGTFQHSIQVANLAESAMHKIGGDPLLVRTGALYHDIGKINNPYYFTENQSPNFNPHDGIEFNESAELIIKHVSDGVQIAKKKRLPEQIIDFIKTHHGTSKVLYFYRLYRDRFPDLDEGLDAFCYPGPKPFSRETAVLMMADAVEAASKAMKDVNVENISSLVDNIIDYQQNDGQFNDSNITFKDIAEIKEVFKKKLQNIYHARIEYPEESASNK